LQTQHRRDCEYGFEWLGCRLNHPPNLIVRVRTLLLPHAIARQGEVRKTEYLDDNWARKMHITLWMRVD
jgi:hypothetical protein